jgi:capsular polysaccharide biosynthesis protein
MTQAAIAAAIAHKVYEAEQINAAMLGHDRVDRALLSYGAWTETFARAFEADRPAVWPRGCEPQ